MYGLYDCSGYGELEHRVEVKVIYSQLLFNDTVCLRKMNKNASTVFLAIIGITNALSADKSSVAPKREPDSVFCHPLIIGHRGASGYVPEHTLASYALAVFMGADYIEPDLVMTRDHQLVARHDNELGLTTDVAKRPEFSCRRTNKTVDGIELTGWFSEDFTLAELKTLRVIERIPDIRPGNARLDGALLIPTLQEIIDLVKALEISQKRVIGLYPEIKHSTYYRSLGLSMEQKLVDILHRNSYKERNDPVYIQSFEVNNLKELKTLTDLRLLQLFESDKSLQPFDQLQLGTNLTYGQMATPEGLREVATYAYAVGPDKSYIIPRDENNNLGDATTFVSDAHAAGLKVHPYTFRAENNFLPSEYQTKDKVPTEIGNLAAEIQAYFDAGIDGLFCDQPDKPARIRNCSR
ncbi:unnamed protein product [Arctia plantaginis]|uniref:glycerophosphodiester phosphodiesterase n=1 Tax=Arctia plantaginis TaxID=874455 RepID=A0A8S0ZRZ7_ARCPL|nr:unnamed protein product [Arctia plantaginis]CAB3248415.1 unnamed protein product [Arctia plantaginis]